MYQGIRIVSNYLIIIYLIAYILFLLPFLYIDNNVHIPAYTMSIDWYLCIFFLFIFVNHMCKNKCKVKVKFFVLLPFETALDAPFAPFEPPSPSPPWKASDTPEDNPKFLDESSIQQHLVWEI